MGCVAGERLVAALKSRRPELWETNSRLAERIEMRIQEARRAHVHRHAGAVEAARCLAEHHPDVEATS